MKTLTPSRIARIFRSLSPASQQFVTVAVLEVAAEKIAPELFLANLAAKFSSEHVDGANAAAVAYSQAAKAVAFLLA